MQIFSETDTSVIVFAVAALNEWPQVISGYDAVSPPAQNKF